MKNKLSFLISIAGGLAVAASVFAAGTFDRNLTVGSRGADVESLQNFLTEHGVYSGPVTGYFGNLTKEGVRKFQTENNISPVSGYFGPLTRSVANNNVFAPSVSVPQSPAQQNIADLQKQIQDLMNQLAALQASAINVPEPVVAAPTTTPEFIPAAPQVLPNPFVSTMTITSDYPSRTLSSYAGAILNEFKLSSVPEKLAITKFRLKNSGDFSDIYFNSISITNSFTGEVLASLDAPINGVAEFTFTPNPAKINKGLMVSGGTYTVMADLRTPSYGGTKPFIRMNIESASDINAVDYDTLTRVANVSGANVFPVIGPSISAF